jgi:hypothetical protein
MITISSPKYGEFKILVDSEDFERLEKFHWTINSQNGYFYARNPKAGLLHRFVLGASEGQIVDHKNRDTLDNRKSNLRVCTRTENQANSCRKKGKWKGVHVEKRYVTVRYRAQLQKNGKRYHKGPFNTEEEAAQAYNELAVLHFGEYALLNELA